MSVSTPLVSVIVPIYNTEKYLRACIESVIHNTYRNLEIILIDDGSTDGCPLICDEYAALDSRIKVIHQSNQGLVQSRQIGIKASKGEWFAFVDSDDSVSSDTYSQMVENALQHGSDVVWCDLQLISNTGNTVAPIHFSPNAQIMVRRLLRLEVRGWFSSKIIRRSFFDLCDIRVFPEHNMYEDVLLSVELLVGRPQMSYVDKPLYRYNRMNESAMTAEGTFVVIRAIPNIRHIYDYLCDKGLWKTYADSFAFLAMSAKLSLLLDGKIHEARSFFPYAHKHLKAYRMQTPVSGVYWIAFNGGDLGWQIFKRYRQWVGGRKRL